MKIAGEKLSLEKPAVEMISSVEIHISIRKIIWPGQQGSVVENGPTNQEVMVPF